jgi:hypothetical protein
MRASERRANSRVDFWQHFVARAGRVMRVLPAVRAIRGKWPLIERQTGG